MGYRVKLPFSSPINLKLFSAKKLPSADQLDNATITKQLKITFLGVGRCGCWSLKEENGTLESVVLDWYVIRKRFCSPFVLNIYAVVTAPKGPSGSWKTLISWQLGILSYSCCHVSSWIQFSFCGSIWCTAWCISRYRMHIYRIHRFDNSLCGVAG